jgi:CRP-like cAMP-binding protein
MTDEFDLAHWLQGTLAFRGLSRSQLASIVQVAQAQVFGKGDLIFRQGGDATGFFVVRWGRVKVFRVSSAGKEQILNIFETGDNFAEVAALDGKPFPASAATLEPSELIFFPRGSFLDLLHQNPDISINILISLSQYLRHLTDVIEELSFKDVPQRLATYLLRLDASSLALQSPPEDRGTVVVLDLTKSQLASALGTIPATLSRAFYHLSREGLIAVNGAQIAILDRDGLQRLSQTLR